MNFLSLIVYFIVFSFVNNLVIKHQIKKNIHLFYDLHRNEIIRVLHKTYPISINTEKKFEK